MKKQAGFTLIELIIVIVILGILAVTASPKFLDLQGDANASTLQGVDGAINSAANIIYGKSIIESEQNAASGEDVDGITTAFGYPTADAAGIIAALDISVDATGNDGADFNTVTDATSIYIYANGTASPTASSNPGTCFVRYVAAADSSTPASTTVNVAGC